MATSIYLKRLKASPKCFEDVLETPNHIFLGVLRLAVKFLDDRPLSREYWCKRASLVWQGTSLSFAQLDSMERKLLERLEWNISCREEELLCHLNTYVASPLCRSDRPRSRVWGAKSEAAASFGSARLFPSRIVKKPKKACSIVLFGYREHLEDLANSTGKALSDLEKRDMNRAAQKNR